MAVVVGGGSHYHIAFYGRHNGTSTQHTVDCSGHWIGLINHLPMPRERYDGSSGSSSIATRQQLHMSDTCNLKLQANGKLIVLRDIRVGEALTFDYGIQYWVHRITGWSWEWWKTYRRGNCCQLFRDMHENVVDYSTLIEMKLEEALSVSHSSSGSGSDSDGSSESSSDSERDVDHLLARLREGVRRSMQQHTQQRQRKRTKNGVR